MNCRSVRSSLSALVDGQLSESQREHVYRHLQQCSCCAEIYQQTLRVQKALRKLPLLAPPPHLTTALLILASRERVRQMTQGRPAALVAYLGGRARLWLDNIMRPVALPVAGGLLSAIILFCTLVPNMLFQRPSGQDVPLLALYSDPAVINPAPFGFDADHFILEVTVDRNGRMVDYSIADGDRLIQNPRLRRSIENYVLFTGFSPARAFGQPVYGRVTVSFSRYQFRVGS